MRNERNSRGSKHLASKPEAFPGLDLTSRLHQWWVLTCDESTTSQLSVEAKEDSLSAVNKAPVANLMASG